MALIPRPEQPIDPITLSIIREVKREVDNLGLDTYLVGATARIILLEHVYGLHAGRATRDIDFAFAVENWEQFQAIKDSLTATSAFEDAGSVVHRLKYKSPSIAHHFQVDLIPFGGVEDNNKVIAWPPDMRIFMNVSGYRDAYASAIPVEIEPGLVISIASIPGIAILKLFAWVDRRQEDPKDAADLFTLLRQYHEAGNQNRLYEDALNVLASVGYDIELAGAWLLGHDAFAMSSEKTRNQLNTLFADALCVERLMADMARGIRIREDALDYSRMLLDQFLKGFAR